MYLRSLSTDFELIQRTIILGRPDLIMWAFQKRALSFSEIRYGKWQTLLPLLALKKEAAMNNTAARKWVPPKAWRTLEVDPSLVKTPDENSAQLLLEFSALWNLEQNSRQSQAQISDLRKLEIISVCCLSHEVWDNLLYRNKTLIDFFAFNFYLCSLSSSVSSAL